MSEQAGKHAYEFDGLRAETQSLINEEFGGNLRAAVGAGGFTYDYGTVHSWLNAKYEGRNDRVAADIRKWIEMRRERSRNAAILPKAPPFQETPSARAFLDAFSSAHHTPDVVMVTGAPGVGKTSACQAYQDRNNGVLLLTGQPSIRTPRALLEEIGEALEVRDRGTSQRISRAIMRRLKGTSSLIIYDEAQHLTTEALDQLRTIHDIAQVGVALVGNETIYPRLEGQGRTAQFAQLFSRIGQRVPRPKPLKSDIDMLLDAWGIEGDRERKLLHVIGRKPGALRSITKVLRQAKMACQLDGSGILTSQHLHDAYSRLSSSELSVEEAA